MGIRQEINHFKNLWLHGSELLLLRVRLLRLDMEEQLAGIIKIVACIAFAAVLTLIFLMALLLGLNAMLPEHIKIGVFFGVAIIALLALLLMIYRIPIIWQNSRKPLNHTLNEMQNDLAHLRGTTHSHFDPLFQEQSDESFQSQTRA
ncbi:MAG: phage holin family protein [Alysiella sp.]|uniref:phage holin family protein n=1 Tax=Alysiella sp. TaxID=1872483 RepID=UPI0026DDA9D7|nr:phage holin family protein [Alysiella sp.]MDO4433122.1 phage holin family protein [Alysiella sp.]